MKRIAGLPEVTLARDGALLSQQEGAGLSEVRVRQGPSLPSACELTFSDSPGPLDAPFPLGSRLQVGVRGFEVALFDGEVTAVEQVFDADGSRELRVRAYDVSHRLRKRQKVRAHLQVTARGLAEELAGGLGLSVVAAEEGPLWELLIQHGQTDLDLLVEVLERCGLYYAVRDGELRLFTLAGLGETLPLRVGESLVEARVELNGDRTWRQVEVAGWDPARAEPHHGVATSARSGRSVSAGVSPEDLGGDGKRSFPGQPTPDDRHAEGIAQAELDTRFAREVTLSGVAEGDPRLRPGVAVEVAGVGDSFAGRYVLTEVTHTIDHELGFVSAIQTAPPAPRRRPLASVCTQGTVTQVDDPERKGRIRVKLPGYFDVETGWVEVLTVGAGASKGLVVLPDVGDSVLVLLAHMDPAEGIVLGGLYGAGGMPDSGGVSGGAVRRFALLTPGGQTVRLDDEERSVRIENAGGSFVELGPDKVTVQAAADLEIAAPGRRVVIRGRAVDFLSG